MGFSAIAGLVHYFISTTIRKKKAYGKASAGENFMKSRTAPIIIKIRVIRSMMDWAVPAM